MLALSNHIGQIQLIQPCRTENGMPEDIADTADLFEIIRTTRSMRRLKPDPVPNEFVRKILEAGVCATAATCSASGSSSSGPPDQEDCRCLL